MSRIIPGTPPKTTIKTLQMLILIFTIGKKFSTARIRIPIRLLIKEPNQPFPDF